VKAVMRRLFRRSVFWASILSAIIGAVIGWGIAAGVESADSVPSPAPAVETTPARP